MLNYFLSAISLSGAKTKGCSQYFVFDEKLSHLTVERMTGAAHRAPEDAKRVGLFLVCEGEPHPTIVPAG
ncbi:hypothetical protein [Rhizobium leguminosarum]|uniref:hypothetical protein n=1 Tax=Rhizobium leguminosarum TaxID=384 RepID=UPI001442431C|nr:hypothetical protein [Rhizobium leguminosarum]NKK80725.1 hypothetical protein [Rhizobium leguminosarum bv. viciae]